MVRKLKSGGVPHLFSEKKDAKTNKGKNLGNFNSMEAAKKHENKIQRPLSLHGISIQIFNYYAL